MTQNKTISVYITDTNVYFNTLTVLFSSGRTLSSVYFFKNKISVYRYAFTRQHFIHYKHPMEKSTDEKIYFKSNCFRRIIEFEELKLLFGISKRWKIKIDQKKADFVSEINSCIFINVKWRISFFKSLVTLSISLSISVDKLIFIVCFKIQKINSFVYMQIIFVWKKKWVKMYLSRDFCWFLRLG